jgi:hypothetical protein
VSTETTGGFKSQLGRTLWLALVLLFVYDLYIDTSSTFTSPAAKVYADLAETRSIGGAQGRGSRPRTGHRRETSIPQVARCPAHLRS